MTNDKLRKNTVCAFCSLGCGLKIELLNGSANALDYDMDNPVNHGSLCPRGNYVLEQLRHPQRLENPKRGKTKISWAEALETIFQKLKGLSPAEIGILASGTLPAEDLLAAANFCENFEISGVEPEPDDSVPLFPLQAENLGTLNTLLILGDPLTYSPVLSQYINKVKYGDRKNRIVVIDSKDTHTSWFATNFIKTKPGEEKELLAALLNQDQNDERVKTLNSVLQKSASLGLIVSLPYDSPCLLKQAKAAVKQFLGTKGYFVTYPIGGTLAAKKILNQVPSTSVRQKLLKGELKALVLAGEDLLASYPQEEMRRALLGLSLLVNIDLFENETSQIAHLTLPMSSYLETVSTFIFSGNNLKTLEPIIGNRGQSRAAREILGALGGKPWQKEFI